MTLAQALQQAAGLGLARLDAQLLLLHALGRTHAERAWLLAHDEQAMDADTQAAWQTLVQRRANGEPVAYLVGRKAFYGLELHIDAQVLDPRDDTETLVDWALAVLPASNTPSPQLLDLGTGSGAIALALKHHLPAADVWAVDASAPALAVAQANATRLQLPLHCVHSDWFTALTGQRFDLVVSNPPYIAANDPHLPALRHEPVSALVSGADGLDALRTLCVQAPHHLRPGAWLLLEHGHDQAAAVRALLQTRGFVQVQSRTDLAGIERCSGGQWPEVK